jgi:uncharacterized membrane protein
VPRFSGRFRRARTTAECTTTGAWVVLWFALTLLGSAVFWASLLILPLGFAGIGLWIVLILKAYQGRVFKLPVIGDLAEKRANNA